MYRIGQLYKIGRKDGIFYTGYILEEDSVSVRINTVRGEEVIINKEEVRTAIAMNSTGDNNGSKR